jgi:glycosyltransferase involved in cell wall biosynthesis
LGVPVTAPDIERRFPEEEAQVILNVGSLEPVKDQSLLLRAFKMVHEALPRSKLIIAGRGRLEGELRRQCAQLNLTERVTFTGEVPHDQLPQLYRRATLCVQTSRHEAQGMAVLEAALCGVPLVGTAVGAIADLSPETAVAVPVGDEVSLAQALISLLRDPARCARLSRAARAVIAREYALTRTVDRTMSMYEVLREFHD